MIRTCLVRAIGVRSVLAGMGMLTGGLFIGGCSAAPFDLAPSWSGSSGTSLDSLASSPADFAQPADFAGEADGGANAVHAQSITRQLIFSGHMSLTVSDVEAASVGIGKWVGGRGGFVESSSASAFDGRPSMYMVLRVPSDEYEALRDHVRGLAVDMGDDRSERVDVTAQHADYSARLETLTLAEAELRELLAAQEEEGGNVETVLSIYRELRTLRTEIDGLQAQLDTLEEQIALSTLSVELNSESIADTSGRAWRVRSTFQSATRDLFRGVQTFTEGLVYFLVAILPMILLWSVVLGVAAWVVARVARLVGWRRPRRRGSSDRDPPVSSRAAGETSAAEDEGPD